MKRRALILLLAFAALSCGGRAKVTKIEQKATDDATLAAATIPQGRDAARGSAAKTQAQEVAKPAPAVKPVAPAKPEPKPAPKKMTDAEDAAAAVKAAVAKYQRAESPFTKDGERQPSQRPPQKPKASKNLEEAKARAEDVLKELERRKKARESGVATATANAQPATNVPSPAAPAARGSEVAQKYKALLNSPSTPEEKRPEILLRLAELSYEDEVAALKVAYELGTYVNLKPGQRYPESVKYYEEIVAKYPDSMQALTAFYNLGYLYSEERMLDEAAEVYKEVLLRDPQNPYALEIQMRLGEAAFSRGRYREAAAYYEDVVAGDRADYKDKANYKLGWSHYKLDDYATAIKVFGRILDKPEGAAHDLVVETIDIMAKCFVEKGGVADVDRYMAGANTAKIYGDLIYQKVGALLLDRSRQADAVKAFERAIEAYPLTDVALEVEKGLVQAYAALRDTEAVNARRALWADLYGPGGAWDKANGKVFGGERDRMLEEGLRLAALYRHSRAQRGEGGQEQALAIYRQYVKFFGDSSENGYEMAFAFAQALKEAGNWDEAATVYAKVARNPSRAAHREEAAYKRIEALDQLRQRDKSRFDEFVAAHDEYVKLNPSSPLVPQLTFAVGELQFGAERFAAAREAFLAVASKFPSDKLTPTAVERVARTWFRENKFADAEREGRRALTLGIDENAKAETQKLISFCVFKEAEEAQEAGKLADATRHFFRLADEFPTTEAAQVSLYRGAELLRKQGKNEEAAAVFRKIADKYGSSKYAGSALTLSSEILSSLGDWKGVADNYEKLYRMNPADAEAENNLFKAAVAREKADDRAAATALFAEFCAKYPSAKRYVESLYRQTALVEKSGDAKATFALWEKLMDTKAVGEDEIYRARAAIKIAEREFEAFKAVELKGNMKKALAEKEKRLDAALTKLAVSAGFPYAETLPASLYRAAECFELMKTAILESERPKGLNEEELEQYQFLLEEKAAPLEERAIDLYRRGVFASRKASLHNEWVDKMYARLEVLMPYAYQRTEQTAAAFSDAPYPGRGWARKGR